MLILLHFVISGHEGPMRLQRARSRDRFPNRADCYSVKVKKTLHTVMDFAIFRQ